MHDSSTGRPKIERTLERGRVASQRSVTEQREIKEIHVEVIAVPVIAPRKRCEHWRHDARNKLERERFFAPQRVAKSRLLSGARPGRVVVAGGGPVPGPLGRNDVLLRGLVPAGLPRRAKVAIGAKRLPAAVGDDGDRPAAREANDALQDDLPFAWRRKMAVKTSNQHQIGPFQAQTGEGSALHMCMPT